MELAKVKSVVLDEALKTKKFPSLHMYIAGFGGFERTSDGCFISKVVKDSDGSPILDIKLALQDYFFNEYHEYPNLWKFAENLLGKQLVDLKVMNIVTL